MLKLGPNGGWSDDLIDSLGLLIIATASTLVAAEPSPMENSVSAPISEVSIPAFVDIDSPVRFEVKAEFPTPCYKFGQAATRLDRDRGVVLFHISAYETQQGCKSEPTQLSAFVDAGRLRPGTYEVLELKSLKKWGSVEVERFEASIRAAKPGLELASRKH